MSKSDAYNARIKREAREVTAAKRTAGIFFLSTARSVDESAARLMELIPDDTRGLTARLMGDPLVGRRAIDRRVP